MTNPLKQLEAVFAKLSTDEEKISAATSYLQSSSDRHPVFLNSSGNTTRHCQQDPVERDALEFVKLMEKHGIQHDQVMPSILGEPTRRTQTHLDQLECANHDITKARQCRNKATKVCSGCRLVSYCSQECQKVHWAAHKRDCKHSLKSKEWRPKWVQDRRSPVFMMTSSAQGWEGQQMFGMCRSLWGNMPALDVLNLENNEGHHRAVQSDFSLAFVASGDLRNVLKTVNGLPDDYNGTMNILINDHDPMVVCRNILVLAILGLGDDVEDAAELALHLWYSVFLPGDAWAIRSLKLYQELGILPSAKATSSHRLLSFGSHSSLNVVFDDETLRTMLTTIATNTISRLTPAVANNALHNVMMAPQRVDYRHRYYLGLEPSHRVAFQEWREFGIVYPFGGCSAHLNVPNPWLFSPDHRLYLNDSASPYQGWDVPAIFEAGKAHGTTREDLIGCLYFYLKDQLLKFAYRLRSFKINISVVNCDALNLASRVRSGSIPGIPRTIAFDRIEVSNIVDAEYVGVKRVLEVWGPLLKSKDVNEHAALIGLFMNWALTTPGATIEGMSKSASATLIDMFATQYQDLVSPLALSRRGQLSPDPTGMMVILGNIEICNENSKHFHCYLRDKGALTESKTAGLQAREKNKIVPHRLGAMLGSPHKSLPQKLIGDERYALMSLYSCTWQERYVEWKRI
ncbi:hypothetical protein D9758_004727 [Tetrapyrgos nigripes]|uniref:MYND-type domain-containing protein n=1 Tax=Tetrapyrgos nigripes TaxID=182062 RepID=A0A8H5H096_9AGAR|nr:hypothetical protein D9758_004727 [Tetrapyrgos nigripes]